VPVAVAGCTVGSVGRVVAAFAGPVPCWFRGTLAMGLAVIPPDGTALGLRLQVLRDVPQPAARTPASKTVAASARPFIFMTGSFPG
jgi:hypothetical protein